MGVLPGLLDQVDAVQGVPLGLVALSMGDDLLVGCSQAPAELAGLVLVYLELGHGVHLMAIWHLGNQRSGISLSCRRQEARLRLGGGASVV